MAEKFTFQEYWDDPRFTGKRPNFEASLSHAYGDNIYHFAENGEWIQEDSHHSFAGGQLNSANLQRDTGADAVLVGHDYIYWGGAAIDIPSDLNSELETDRLYPPARSHRSNFDPQFIKKVDDWFISIVGRGLQGRPASW
ncbi:MAG: hypothetical protein EOP37_07200 [Rubrivivax sp.]|nr:MAG: hypothetical protein EOP37_07200 [Rubrivivax sp.]